MHGTDTAGTVFGPPDPNPREWAGRSGAHEDAGRNRTGRRNADAFRARRGAAQAGGV